LPIQKLFKARRNLSARLGKVFADRRYVLADFGNCSGQLGLSASKLFAPVLQPCAVQRIDAAGVQRPIERLSVWHVVSLACEFSESLITAHGLGAAELVLALRGSHDPHGSACRLAAIGQGVGERGIEVLTSTEN
jgi:hypothetical protein